MKKSVFKLVSFAIICAMLFVASCKDENPVTPPVVGDLEDGIMNGALTENYTLDATVQYSLTGAFTISDGVTLTIPAGTNIIADANGTGVFIAVLMGGKINIEGTASNPVIMTSENAEAGDWGGLTICGKANTTAGENAEAEVGGFIYGGNDAADNSGSIEYLVIKGTGAQINEESQYNGVSFYAVGSGTVVENLAVMNGADDGVEFFGGSVSVTNLFLENNEDDAIDWTEGWDGMVENSYISHTISGFSTVVEADKENANPTLKNITAVATTGGTALQFKKESGATITGLYLSGYTVELDMKDAGALSNVIIEGSIADATLLEGETSKYTLNSGVANEPTVDISDWTWVNASLSANLSGNVIGEVTLDPAVSYTLTSSYIVQNGGTLNIPAGTKITAVDGGTSVYIAVLMGGKININGTADSPVVISAASATPGDWGGLTICGKATTTAGVDAEAEVGGFIYGGTEDNDNSGSIDYLVIKGTGAQINEESQYNGVSLYAVGTGTTIGNVAVINGADDGVEFFGGTVEVENVFLENNEDDAVDWTEGWSGGITNTYISHTVSGFSTAFEGDKENNNPMFENVTAISSKGGTALQFKKESGATINNLHIDGYTVELDMKDGGALSNVQIAGSNADGSLIDGEDSKYTLDSGNESAPTVDISGWGWINAGL